MRSNSPWRTWDEEARLLGWLAMDERYEMRKSRRKVPMENWKVMLPEHREGYVEWEEWLAIQQRLAANSVPDAAAGTLTVRLLHQARRGPRSCPAALAGGTQRNPHALPGHASALGL